MKRTFIMLTILITIVLLYGCGAIFGGKISDCQKHHPDKEQPKRKIRPAALIFDIFSWPFISLPVDFATGGIYKPCTLPAGVLDSLERQKNIFRKQAHPQAGQIIISAGEGFSPEFNGIMVFVGQLYPISFISVGDWNSDEPPQYVCSSVTPNYSGMIEYLITQKFSIGFAGSYQSEIVNWDRGGNTGGDFYDKITRDNVALRFLYHVPLSNKHFDLYTGVRIGRSYWTDDTITNGINTHTYYNGNAKLYYYFINAPKVTVYSFQVLAGFSYYPIAPIGLHVEFGIGSPYLVEGGLSFRINTRRSAKEDDNGGH